MAALGGVFREGPHGLVASITAAKRPNKGVLGITGEYLVVIISWVFSSSSDTFK